MTNSERSNESEIAVYLGLGSNIGDREANLRGAIERVKTLGLEITRESSIYETEPVGFTDQPWFLNQVIELKIIAALTSEHAPVPGASASPAIVQAEALLSELLKFEDEMGRERRVANGPRVIDIDLLLFGDLIIGYVNENDEWLSRDGAGLLAPHPRMHLRRFVLEPLCEIAPKVVHPVLNKTCREILASLDDASTVRLYNKGAATSSPLINTSLFQ